MKTQMTNRLCPFFPFPALLTILASINSFAHDTLEILPASSLTALGSITYRNSNAVEAGQAWQIPGVLLGGEALPSEKGLVMDDLQLLGHYKVNNTYSVSAKLSSHSHGEENGLALENIGFTWDTANLLTGTFAELGRITTDTTRTAYYHAAESPFSEAPLLSDVFFGRHFNDMGAKFRYHPGPLSLGLEAWSGDAWPFSDNTWAHSAYIGIRSQWQGGEIQLRAWAMHGSAIYRSDQRYGNGHSHGGQNIQSPAADIGFTGDSEMSGVSMISQYDFGALQLKAEGEIIQSRAQGLLSNTTNQESAYESTYDGIRGLLQLQVQSHKFSIQYEELTLENIFLDAINLVFLEQTGLQNNGFSPSKTMATWMWQLHPDFALRVEWIDDQSRSSGNTLNDIPTNDNDRRGGIGLVWQRRLY